MTAVLRPILCLALLAAMVVPFAVYLTVARTVVAQGGRGVAVLALFGCIAWAMWLLRAWPRRARP